MIASCGSSARSTSSSQARSAAAAARTRGSSVAEATGVSAEVASLLADIPERRNALGSPKAPVRLEYFGDLQCPYCRQFTLGALPDLIERYVRRGKLKIEYHALESATRDPATFKAQQIAALAAGSQNKMWPYLELFYREQRREDSGYVTESYLQGLAQQVPGLNLPAWTAARGDAALADTISRDALTASYARFRGTPSFLIGTAAGRLWRFNPGSFTLVAPYAATIEQLLRFGHPRTRSPSSPKAIGVARLASRAAARGA